MPIDASTDNVIIGHMVAHFAQLCVGVTLIIGSIFTFFFVRLESKLDKSTWKEWKDAHNKEHEEIKIVLKEIMQEFKQLNEHSIHMRATLHEQSSTLSRLCIDRDLLHNDIKKYLEQRRD